MQPFNTSIYVAISDQLRGATTVNLAIKQFY